MAKYRKGILGPVRGTVGTVVGSSWRSIDYLRSRPSGYRDRKSDAQKAQRDLFKKHAAMARGMLTAARIGLRSLAARTTEYNVLMRRLHQAGEHYEQLRISSGVHPALEGLTATHDATAGRVTVRWTPAAGRAEDLACVAVAAPGQSYAASAVVKQALGSAELPVPEAPGVMYAYAFGADALGERASDTGVVKVS